MDKLGPMARSVEDCALVLDAVHGSDGGDDPGAVDRPFAWPVALDWPRLKVGFLPGGDEAKREELNVLRGLGAKLVPIALPNKAPAGAITTMLDVEAGASFDKLTRDHVTEGLNSWPTTFRQAQFVTAIEYLRASRARTLLVREMAELMDQVDLYVAAAGVDLAITNLTGSPSVVVPSGLARRGESGGRPRPVAIAFTGRPFDESRLLAVAMAYQNATGHHLRRPPLERFLAEDAPVGPGGAGP